MRTFQRMKTISKCQNSFNVVTRHKNQFWRIIFQRMKSIQMHWYNWKKIVTHENVWKYENNVNAWNWFKRIKSTSNTNIQFLCSKTILTHGNDLNIESDFNVSTIFSMPQCFLQFVNVFSVMLINSNKYSTHLRCGKLFIWWL